MVGGSVPRPDKFDEMLAERAGQVLIVDAPTPGAGWPCRGMLTVIHSTGCSA